MDHLAVIERFKSIYLGDSLLKEFILRIEDAELCLVFHAGSIVDADNPDIFSPVAKFKPARLKFLGVQAISFEERLYELNSTVIGFDARMADGSSHVEFLFELSGGPDAESFINKIRILALDFDFGTISTV